MAVKREIRTTLALDGENEYNKALSEAQRGLRVLGSELVQKYVGEGARIVRELFQLARSKKACIVGSKNGGREG